MNDERMCSLIRHYLEDATEQGDALAREGASAEEIAPMVVAALIEVASRIAITAANVGEVEFLGAVRAHFRVVRDDHDRRRASN